MPTITIPFDDFAAGTDAVADEVDANFDEIKNWINQEGIHRDAIVPFTAHPSGPATNPTGDNQYARKAYVDFPVLALERTDIGHATQTDWADFGSAWTQVLNRGAGTFSVAGSPMRFTLNQAGLYVFAFYYRYDSNPNGNFRGFKIVNSGSGNDQVGDADRDNGGFSPSIDVRLSGVTFVNVTSPPQTFKPQHWQNSGVSFSARGKILVAKILGT